jgi:hypothetical protein
LKSKLHFLRYEFKYVLPLAKRDEVEAELQHFLQLDPYVSGLPGTQYFVRSLYYDDPSFTAFFEKTDGLHTRSKYRVRTYTDDPKAGVVQFLELKGRHNNLVFKHRCPLTLPEGPAVALSTARETNANGRPGEDWIKRVLDRAEPGTVRDQFEYQVYRRRIAPNVLIDYWRRPYISKYDPEFRLTFDSELRCTASDTLFPSSSASPRRMLPGYTVLEVKFRYHVPSWFHRIIQAFELRRRSISKICEGTQTLGLAEDPA